MAVSFASYEIARSGLFVNERGLYVTGHNISNVNTPGYVRQQAMITTGPYQSEPAKYGVYQLGLGADIQQIRQIRHSFLDNIYRQENTNLGYWEARNKTFQDVQAILGEPMGVGLQGVMNQFWDSWQELSKEPDSLTVRALVRQRGQALVHHINHLGTQLDKLQSDLNSEVRVRIDEVNDITRQIAKLNSAIIQAEVSGDTANDYRDQRNVLVDRLTKLAGVEVLEMQDGQLDITLGGYFLVSKAIQTNLYAGEAKPGDVYVVPKLEGTNIAVSVKSGTLKGLMESRGEVSGARGSIENGLPNTKADIIIAIDTSNTSASYLANVKANIEEYAAQLNKRGVDYNLRLVTYGDTASTAADFGTDAAALAAAIPAGPLADTGNNFGGANGLLERIEGINDFRQDANRFALVFTGESIEGDSGTDVTDVSALINRLNTMGVNMSVVTDSSYFDEGETSAELGWRSITHATGGSVYDINTATTDYPAVMQAIAADTSVDVNSGISTVPHTDNIISDLKKRLNALVNIMVREVNYVHSEGRTLNNQPGGNFFAAVNDEYSIDMTNLKLDDSLLNLNNIVASASGDNGDNTLALRIANLRHNSVMQEVTGILSMDDYYQSIILNIGHYGNDAARIMENQQHLVNSSDAYRQSIMGVSMDEEMSNMMKYKFAYNASSRAINVIDEMIETVVTRMGLAGR